MPKNPKPPQHHHFVAPCEYRRISDIKPRVKSRVWPGWAISQRIHPHFSFQLFNPPPLYPPSPWAPRMNHSHHSPPRKRPAFKEPDHATFPPPCLPQNFNFLPSAFTTPPPPICFLLTSFLLFSPPPSLFQLSAFPPTPPPPPGDLR